MVLIGNLANEIPPLPELPLFFDSRNWQQEPSLSTNPDMEIYNFYLKIFSKGKLVKGTR